MVIEALTMLFNISASLFLLYCLLKRRRELALLPRIDCDGSEEGVSVIVPVRGEGEEVYACLRSLKAQRKTRLQIIFVDDSSYKSLSGLAGLFTGVTVKDAGERPEGWVGKSWPCYVGYRSAVEDILLFLDADAILLRDDVISRAACALRHERLDYLSLFPRFELKDVWVQVVLPLYLNAILIFSPPSAVNREGSKKSFMFGAFAMIRREAYEAVKGHESVRDEIVEDKVLGERLRGMGFKFRLYRGDGEVLARWGGDVKTLWNSLLRVLTNILGPRVGAALLVSLALTIVFVIPPITLVFAQTLPQAITSASATTLALLLHGLELRRNRGSIIWAFAYPLAAAFTAAALIWTGYRLRRGGLRVEWKGRSYTIKASRR